MARRPFRSREAGALFALASIGGVARAAADHEVDLDLARAHGAQ